MVDGPTRSVPGRGKAAREGSGTNEASPGLLTTYSTVRGITCQTLKIDFSFSVRVIEANPTLPRYGTDLLPHLGLNRMLSVTFDAIFVTRTLETPR